MAYEAETDTQEKKELPNQGLSAKIHSLEEALRGVDEDHRGVPPTIFTVLNPRGCERKSTFIEMAMNGLLLKGINTLVIDLTNLQSIANRLCHNVPDYIGENFPTVSSWFRDRYSLENIGAGSRTTYTLSLLQFHTKSNGKLFLARGGHDLQQALWMNHVYASPMTTTSAIFVKYLLKEILDTNPNIQCVLIDTPSSMYEVVTMSTMLAAHYFFMGSDATFQGFGYGLQLVSDSYLPWMEDHAKEITDALTDLTSTWAFPVEVASFGGLYLFQRNAEQGNFTQNISVDCFLHPPTSSFEQINILDEHAEIRPFTCMPDIDFDRGVVPRDTFITSKEEMAHDVVLAQVGAANHILSLREKHLQKTLDERQANIIIN